jgi:hypothetical protein
MNKIDQILQMPSHNHLCHIHSIFCLQQGQTDGDLIAEPFQEIVWPNNVGTDVKDFENFVVKQLLRKSFMFRVSIWNVAEDNLLLCYTDE